MVQGRAVQVALGKDKGCCLLSPFPGEGKLFLTFWGYGNGEKDIFPPHNDIIQVHVTIGS